MQSETAFSHCHIGELSAELPLDDVLEAAVLLFGQRVFQQGQEELGKLLGVLEMKVVSGFLGRQPSV